MSSNPSQAGRAGVQVEISERRRRRDRDWRRRRWRRRRRVVGLVLTPLIAVVLYSYVSTMLQPSSLPLGIRSIEWMRANGAAWIVNDGG